MEKKSVSLEEMIKLVAQVADGKLEMPQFKSMEEAERFSLLLCCEIEKKRDFSVFPHKRTYFVLLLFVRTNSSSSTFLRCLRFAEI